MPATNFDALAIGPSNVAINPNHYEVVNFYIAGAQTAAAKKSGALISFAGTVVDVRAYVDTAPTGAALIVDVNKNGTTLFTTQDNRPTVAISGNASTAVVPDVPAVAAGDRITIDVDQIGSVVAGSDVYVSVTIKRAHAA